jgi:hypothetical protein
VRVAGEGRKPKWAWAQGQGAKSLWPDKRRRFRLRAIDHRLLCMPCRLNAFQLSMLQWNDLHAYNAVHVARVPEPLAAERLVMVVRRTLEAKGLTGLVLDRRAGTYEYRGGPGEVEIKHICPTSLVTEMERQLNTRFDYEAAFVPFRFFILPEEDAFYLGLAYFHPVADAECIVFLLREIVEAYRGKQVEDGLFNGYPPPPDRLLRSRSGVLARKLASMPSSIRAMQRTCRPNYHDPGNFHNGLTMFSLEAPVLEQLLKSAKALKVTLNDLFLAILMKAVSTLAPDRAETDRRKNLAVGCIVNTRKDLGLDGRRDFGLFLGSFVVHHRAPPGVGVPDLARDIASQTRSIKQKRLYLGAAVELNCGRLLVSLFSERRRKRLYQKHYPLWGGLTNMNLNTVWPQPDEARRVDYFRAVSTGPVTPLVASITTVGGKANVSLAYRSTVFGTSDIERVKQFFLDPAGSHASL